MSDLYGEYEQTEVPDVEIDNDWFEVKVITPSIPQGNVLLLIDHYEPHAGVEAKPGKPGASFGYDFYFAPHSANGQEFDLVTKAKLLYKYFFMGYLVGGKLQDANGTGTTKAFLFSIGVGTEKKAKLSQELVRGVQVSAKIGWEKVLSKNPNPKTGKVPERIDESDPYSYYQAARILDGSVRGIRDEDGEVVKLVSVI